MKKLIVLIICLILNCKSFSQTDTTKAVILNERVSRFVIKDLILLDQYSEENRELKNLVSLTEKKITVQSGQIENLTLQKEALLRVVSSKDEIINTDNEIMANDSKLLKKADRKVWWYKAAAYISLGMAGFFALSR